MAGVGVVAGISTAAIVAPAVVSAVPEVSAEPCGFFATRAWAWYNHCPGPVRTNVQIKVDTFNGPGSYQCVKPGVTGLGPNSVVKGTYYTGVLC